MSLPWIAYSDLTGREKPRPTSSQVDNGDVKYVKVLSDVVASVYDNRRRGFPEFHLSLRQWWRTLAAKRKIVAEFCWDDPMPGLYAVAILMSSAASFLRRRGPMNWQPQVVSEMLRRAVAGLRGTLT